MYLNWRRLPYKSVLRVGLDANMALQRFPSFLAPTQLMEMMETRSKDVVNLRNYKQNTSPPGNWSCKCCKEVKMHLTCSLTTQRRLFPSSQHVLDQDEVATRLLTRITRKERRKEKTKEEKMTDLEKLADQQDAEPIPPR